MLEIGNHNRSRYNYIHLAEGDIMIPRRALAPVFGLLAISACTSIDSRSLSQETKPAKGIVYYLPHKLFDITLTWELRNCDVTASTEKTGSLVLTVKTTAAVNSHIVSDRSQSFVVDPDDLRSFFKDNDSTINLNSFMLTGVNLKQTDQTADILTNTVASGLKIAALATGVPLPTGADKARLDAARARFCGTTARTALDEITALEKAQIGKKEDSTEYLLLQKGIEKIRSERLTYKGTGFVNPTGDDRVFDRPGTLINFYPPRSVVDSWVTAEGRANIAAQDSARPTSEKILVDGKLLPLQVQFLAVATSSQSLKGQGNKALPGDTGLAYRQPAQALIVACQGICPNPLEQSSLTQTIFMSFDAVPQFGILSRLPFNSKAFETGTLSANFGDTGGLTTAHYTSTSAGKAATGALSQSLDTAGKYATAFDTHRKSKGKAEFEQLKAVEDAEAQYYKSALAKKKAKAELDSYKLEE